MISSLKTLFEHPYNKKRPFYALLRFIYWKLMRLFKIKNQKYSLWKDKCIIVSFDSFQSMWVLYNYIIDWEEFNLIAKLLKSNDCAFDIGANMGVYTIWMSKFINQDGEIHSFEPDSENFNKLTTHISINSIKDRTYANNYALGELVGYAYFTTTLDGENHITEANKPDAFRVKVSTLDQYVKTKRINFIKYMKIDVEGFELSVLKGAVDLLRNKKILIIQLEINQTVSNSNTKIESLVNYLSLHSYRLCEYRITENRVSPLKYSRERENYFAIANIDMVNNLLELEQIET